MTHIYTILSYLYSEFHILVFCMSFKMYYNNYYYNTMGESEQCICYYVVIIIYCIQLLSQSFFFSYIQFDTMSTYCTLFDYTRYPPLKGVKNSYTIPSAKSLVPYNLLVAKDIQKHFV